MNNYKFLNFISSGTFGKVYKAIDKNNNSIVAIKKINLTKLTPYDLENLYNECRIGFLADCEFIIKILDIFFFEDYIYIVTKYYENGDLRTYINNHGKLSDEHIWKIMTQLFLAVDYLHENNIIHRDIKIQNILVKNNGDIVLADLGVTKILNNSDYTKTQIGTPYYFSPEIANGSYYTKAIDIWCCGIVLYEILFNKYPFNAHNLPFLLRRIRNDIVEFPKYNGENSLVLISLCNKLLAKTTSMRPPIGLLLKNKNVNEIMFKNGYYISKHLLNFDNCNYDSKISIQKNLDCFVKKPPDKEPVNIYKENQKSIGIQVNLI